ncbi:ankyrin repeat domain-containing protein [Thiosocius teredinicola]|uniref:ankyrin repeat domain-containing protein n=1 Tax=Thiosocius teredinicola TaxID=1973002 RepID=UPI000F788319
MIGHEGSEYGFDRLFDAVQFFPEKVPAMVREDPAILECRSYAGETVLNWFSMEGKEAIVELLLACGARPDSISLSYALEQGHIEVVSLLMASGCVPAESDVIQDFRRARLPRNKKVLLKRIFYGYG